MTIDSFATTPQASASSRAAEPATAARNTEAATVPWLDKPDDREDAERGFIATIDPMVIRDEAGREVWSLEEHAFLDDDREDSVHPTLWRMARLNRIHGLFQVAPRIYQVRGFDLSNLTVILSENGYILVDPLTCVETASAAFDLIREQLGDRPITGMIFTHSHIDHFGGAGGVISREEAASIPVVAPEGFAHHAVIEHVNSGVAVSRRTQFMFGRSLAAGPRGQVTTGLGITLPSGRISLIEPNVTVTSTGEELVIDGVRIVFQFTPGAEAPTEVNFHLPDLRALCMAETVSHHMHNLYTLRGAQVRDALAWSSYLDEAIDLFGDTSDVMVISHHWPVWGAERITRMVSRQRDLYRYIHDQTLRLANHGLSPVEIAETLTLPTALHGPGNRGNYGSLSHNVKAVYQRYLGWFDANPANLHPLPPRELGHRYVTELGGADAVVAAATHAFSIGDYRWAAELLKQVLAVDPKNTAARLLQADVFEQLGYQSESGPWRNFYLLAAAELRGTATAKSSFLSSNAEMAFGMDLSMLLDFLAIRLNGPRATEADLNFGVVTEDEGASRLVIVKHGVLRQRTLDDQTTTRLTGPHRALAQLALGATTLDLAVGEGCIRIEGNAATIEEAFSLLDDFAGDFDVTSAHDTPVPVT